MRKFRVLENRARIDHTATNNTVRTMIPKRHKTTTVDTVLHQLRLPQYNSAFQKHHIDFASFLRISDQALKTIGVQNESHRQRIVMCSRKMQEVVCRTIAEEPLATGVPPCDAPSTPARDNGTTTSTDEYEKSPLWDDPELLERVMISGGLERQPLTPITEESSVSAEPEQPPEFDQESDGFAAVMGKSHDRGTKRRHASSTVRSIDSVDEEPDVSLLGAPTAAATTNGASNLIPRSARRSLDEATIARRRQRAAERDPNWRSSMPVIPRTVHDLDATAPPSYNDAMLTKTLPLPPKPLDYEEIGKEELPSYTCSVHRSGYVFRKCERTSHNSKARDRAWRRNYLYLWGTLLRIYKSEPVDVNRISPSYELSMRDARVTLATDYTKRRHVLRVTFDTTGHQFLFQAAGREDCIGWIENLQSAANISPAIDELEMPLFITLTTRRRRMMFGTGYFADMARDLQQLPLPAIEPISVGNRMS